MQTDHTLPGATSTSPLNSMAPWLALAAVGIGVAGVMREVSRRRMTGDPLRTRFVADDHALTPPHGDKLLQHRDGVV